MILNEVGIDDILLKLTQYFNESASYSRNYWESTWFRSTRIKNLINREIPLGKLDVKERKQEEIKSVA